MRQFQERLSSANYNVSATAARNVHATSAACGYQRSAFAAHL